MTEPKFTPWQYRPDKYDDWGIVKDSRCFVICQVRDPDKLNDDVLAEHRKSRTDPWEAKARLVSAAPEMYQALVEAVEVGLVPKSSAKDGGAPKYSSQVAVADKIRAAIAKAKGGEA